MNREERAARDKLAITSRFPPKQQVFIVFVLSQYVKVGVDELAQEKLTRYFASSTTTPSRTPWLTWASRKRSERYLLASKSICTIKPLKRKRESNRLTMAC